MYRAKGGVRWRGGFVPVTWLEREQAREGTGTQLALRSVEEEAKH